VLESRLRVGVSKEWMHWCLKRTFALLRNRSARRTARKRVSCWSRNSMHTSTSQPKAIVLILGLINLSDEAFSS
jgi:hypothetical protein